VYENTRWRQVALWIGSSVVGLFFVVAGVKKFVDPKMVDIFAEQGYEDWLRVVIGVAEVGGGLLLLVPSGALYGAAGLGIIMVGAIGTHFRGGKPTEAIIPVVLLILLSIIGYARSPGRPRKPPERPGGESAVLGS
jgi:uncharacterized membrane protein YphA (DoxX/SURF4 family)